MGTKPDPGNFPRRNRISAACRLGTHREPLETAERDYRIDTLDQIASCSAFPGNITEKLVSAPTGSFATDTKLVQSVDDIIAELKTSLRPS